MKTRTPIRPVVVVHKRTTYTPHLLAVFLLWALAMTLDYHDQATAAEAAHREAQATLLACMNGEARWTTETGEEVGCVKAETNRPPRLSP